MKKILHTFFFGYAPYRYRRLIRTPIVLTVLILFVSGIWELNYYFKTRYFYDSYINDDHLFTYLYFNTDDQWVAIFCILLGVAVISFIIEPFTQKKGEVKVVLKDTTESIYEDSITKEKPIADALDEVIANNRIPVSDNLKKVYKTVIRIVMFLVIYLSLFTIIFYAEFLLLTPVIVLVSFFLSKPLTNTLVLKWFPNLEK